MSEFYQLPNQIQKILRDKLEEAYRKKEIYNLDIIDEGEIDNDGLKIRKEHE